MGSWVCMEVGIDLGGDGGRVEMSEIHYVKF